MKLRCVLSGAVLWVGLATVAACGGGEAGGTSGAAGAGGAAAAAETAARLPVARVAPEYSDTTESFRGVLIMGDELDIFRPCGTEMESWIIDRSRGQLSRALGELGAKPYQSAYAELRGLLQPPLRAGPGADYDSKIVIQEIVTASADTTLCH